MPNPTPQPTVTKLRQYRRSNPKYEVFAPPGFHFTEGPHSFLAYDAEEARGYTKYEIERCPEDCDCEEEQ